MKGIILAGGTGSRLWPSTICVSKQLLPVYDKPLIYYPLSTLMLAGIREILIISTPNDSPAFQKLLGDGQNLGINLSYEIQEKPEGLAQAFIISKKFIGAESVALILGDNIFHGSGLGRNLAMCTNPIGAQIFGYEVTAPQQYGVAEIDQNGHVISIEEKPTEPKSNYAIPGIYFYDNEVVEIAENIKPSHRGEIEITDINKEYLRRGKLKVSILDRGTAWFDTGTFNSLMQASQFVQVIEERQGLKIGSIEEAAYKMGFINAEQLTELAKPLLKSGYGKHLLEII